MTDTRSHALRFGKSRLSLNLPASATLLIGPHIPELPDPVSAVRDALQNPIGSDALQTIAKAKNPKSVVITISDITRPVPNELLLTAILEELNAAGVPDSACTVLIATGMHLPSTPEERDILMGPALQKRVRVVDHDSRDTASMVRIADDPPISINRLYAEADLKIVTGLIEPHFMAGFSGGRKGVCPGLVDLATLQRFHGYATMADQNSVEGRLIGNPCHEIATRAAHTVGVDFLVNVCITHGRKPAGIYAGDLDQAFLAGCHDSAKWTAGEFDEPFDLVVTCGGGFPLDTSFYQTVKGMCCALPAVKPDGTMLIVADCQRVGDPEYAEIYERFGPDWRGFLNHIANSGKTEKDQWEYQMQARVLEKLSIERTILANDGLDLQTQHKIAVTPAPGQGNAQTRAQSFIDQYINDHPDARIAVIPEGPYTMLTTPVLVVG